jgi:hypothetical protein
MPKCQAFVHADCLGSEKAALLFMKCFFITMGREWFGIDRWRMDKFMMMTRRFLRQVSRQSFLTDSLSQVSFVPKFRLEMFVF